MTVNPIMRGKLTMTEYTPSDSLIPSKKRCGNNDDSDCFSESITGLEEWTNPYVSKTPPRESNGLSNFYPAQP